MSSRHSRLAMRRPVQTHSGAPAELDSFLGRFLIFADGFVGGLLRGLLGRLLVALGFSLLLLLGLRRFGRLLLPARLRQGGT